MVTVDVSKYRNFDKAIQVFRIKVRQARVLESLSSKSYFVSPGEKQRRVRIKRKVRQLKNSVHSGQIV